MEFSAEVLGRIAEMARYGFELGVAVVAQILTHVAGECCHFYDRGGIAAMTQQNAAQHKRGA